MSDERLLPCPFCGSQLEMLINNPWLVYQHPENGCLLSKLVVRGTDIEKWSTRELMERIAEKIVKECKKNYADKLVAHLRDEIEGCKPLYCGRTNGKSIAYGIVLGLKSAIAFTEALATIEAEPVTAEWIRPTMINGINFNIPHCSGCGKVPCDEGKFCPNCGAKMKGD